MKHANPDPASDQQASFRNPAVISWLEKIFRSKISDSLRLASDKDGFYLHIGHAGAKIIFPVIEALWRTGDASLLPCIRWPAANDGYTPPCGSDLPAPGLVMLLSRMIEEKKSDTHVQYDVPGLIYWMLSRAEEVDRSDLDDHQRFPARASHAFVHNYLDRPIVDEWLEIVRQIVVSKYAAIQLVQPQFQVLVSHDVDQPAYFRFRSPLKMCYLMAKDILRGRNIKKWLLACATYFKSFDKIEANDLYNSFNRLMDISERNGLKSGFYFQVGGTNHYRDCDFTLDHPAIRSLLRDIHRRGHEIGLHPGYESYADPSQIIKQANILKQACVREGIDQNEWGGRMHYLRWKTPDTLYGWQQAGMDYDSTLGYADMPGFRCGTCHDYPAFDPVREVEIDLMLRPLVVMEKTIMDKKYLGIDNLDEAYERIALYKNRCRAVNGNFTLLWHNSSFDRPEYFDLYERSASAA